MKKLWNKADLPYIITTVILGCLNHFLFEWTGESAFAALFCPVNESTWEHLKLLFFPYLFIIIWIYYHQYRTSLYRYFCSRILAVLLGMLSIIMLFYTYTGVIGQNFFVMDILIFIVSVLLTFRAAPVFYRFHVCREATTLVFAGWIFIMLCFFFFTCHPPNIPLFFPSAN